MLIGVRNIMKSNLNLYPQKKIQPFDGMSITAEVWAEAHAYHARALNAHQHLLHGSGIITGLEVVASDPANSIVFILPGAAVDTAGQVIVLPEAVAYDLGQKMQGKLRLLMLHREIKTQSAADGESNAPAYVQDEFVIVAREEVPDLPYVELARLERGDPHQPIQDAPDFAAPRANQIDLRFRQAACPAPVEPVLTGVCALGQPARDGCAQGVQRLADQVASQTRFHLIVEDAVSLDAGLQRYGLVILATGAGARLTKEQADALRAYLANGGRLLVETRAATRDEFSALLKPAGIVLEALPSTHEIFQKPNLFYLPPIEPGELWSWGGVVLCVSGGYGDVWSGQAPREQLTRGALRDALEWGVNLVNYLLRQE